MQNFCIHRVRSFCRALFPLSVWCLLSLHVDPRGLGADSSPLCECTQLTLCSALSLCQESLLSLPRVPKSLLLVPLLWLCSVLNTSSWQSSGLFPALPPAARPLRSLTDHHSAAVGPSFHHHSGFQLPVLSGRSSQSLPIST